MTPCNETAIGPVGTTGGAGAGSWSPTMWPARKEAPRWLAGERWGRSQEWTQPRVGSGATLDGVDHLGHPKATVDEAQIEFQVGNEGSHRHGTVDDLLAPLPDHKQDASTHERGVDRPETAAQPHQGQVGVGLLPRQRVHAFHGCASAAKQPEHTDTGQLLLERRGQGGIGFAGGRGATGDPATRRLGQQHGHGHRQQGQHGQGRVIDEHGDHEREGKQEGVPGLDGKLAHAHTQHLDVADNTRHHVASRGAVQPCHRPGNDAAPRIRPDIGTDTGVGRHEPPALDNAGDFGEQRAAHKGQGGPAHGAWRQLSPRSNASAASIAWPSRIAGSTTAVFMMIPAMEPSTSCPATCRKYGRISQR